VQRFSGVLLLVVVVVVVVVVFVVRMVYVLLKWMIHQEKKPTYLTITDCLLLGLPTKIIGPSQRLSRGQSKTFHGNFRPAHAARREQQEGFRPFSWYDMVRRLFAARPISNFWKLIGPLIFKNLGNNLKNFKRRKKRAVAAAGGGVIYMRRGHQGLDPKLRNTSIEFAPQLFPHHVFTDCCL
jgi:hypothetical protein